ncbi:MAG: extracellular solute-binding protein [Victivallaceae bacterium]
MPTHPKYIKLSAILLEKIKSGCFPDGKLDSLVKIAKANKVSLLTAQKAVKLLEKDGIVTCNPDNRGTTINPGKADFLNGTASFNPFRDIVVYTNKKVKINYFNSEYLPVTKTGWDNIVDAFQRQYPWIEVTFVDSSSFSDTAVGGNQCDAFQIMSRDLQYWLKQGIIAPLDEFMDGNMSFFENMHEKALPSCRVNGMTYALPQSFSVPLIFYHKRRLPRIMPENGINSWGELASLVEKMDKYGLQAYFNIGLWTLWSHFIGNVAGNMLKSQYDADLIFSLELLKHIHSLAPHSLCNDFFTGNGALICVYSSCIDLFTEHLAEWRADVLPLRADGIRAFSPLVNCVDSRSRHQEEAFLFIKFITSEHAQKELALHNNSFPFHKKFANNNFYSKHRKHLRELDFDSMLNSCESLAPPSPFINILHDNIILPVLNKYFTASLDTRCVLDYIKSRIEELYPVYLKTSIPPPK